MTHPQTDKIIPVVLEVLSEAKQTIRDGDGSLSDLRMKALTISIEPKRATYRWTIEAIQAIMDAGGTPDVLLQFSTESICIMISNNIKLTFAKGFINAR